MLHLFSQMQKPARSKCVFALTSCGLLQKLRTLKEKSAAAFAALKISLERLEKPFRFNYF